MCRAKHYAEFEIATRDNLFPTGKSRIISRRAGTFPGPGLLLAARLPIAARTVNIGDMPKSRTLELFSASRSLQLHVRVTPRHDQITAILDRFIPPQKNGRRAGLKSTGRLTTHQAKN